MSRSWACLGFGPSTILVGVSRSPMCTSPLLLADGLIGTFRSRPVCAGRMLSVRSGCQPPLRDRGQAVSPVERGHEVADEKAEKILAALGGASNIIEIEPCITRLRCELNDGSVVDEKALKALGAHGVMRQ